VDLSLEIGRKPVPVTFPDLRNLLFPEPQRLLEAEASAGGMDDLVGCMRFHELESIPKSTSLSNCGINGYWAVRQLELQFYELPEGNFKFQKS
jgi:hypothetical protein